MFEVCEVGGGLLSNSGFKWDENSMYSQRRKCIDDDGTDISDIQSKRHTQKLSGNQKSKNLQENLIVPFTYHRKQRIT